MTLRLGLIINPIAGMGGSVGLKGTDGALAESAAELGAVPIAGERARTALSQLAELGPELTTLTCSGAMGEAAVADAGLTAQIVHRVDDYPSTAKDTRAAASRMLAERVDLMLFVGGDGTARDLLHVIGESTPVLGVPSGVKMHSAVFAASARAAGEVAHRFLTSSDRESLLEDVEIMDRQESADGHVAMSPELFGLVRTPRLEFLVPGAKATMRVPVDVALRGAIRRVCELVADDRISLIGPGSTMLAVKRHLGFDGTPLGVDVFANGHCIAPDADERSILELIEGHKARIVVSIVGGQGFLFGRGNQQLSSRVISHVGTDDIVIVCPLDKLASLSANCLLVDTGDEALDRRLAGYMPVIVSGVRTAMMRVRYASLQGST